MDLSSKVQRLRKKFLRIPNQTNEQEYRNAKKMLQSSIRRNKMNYYKDELQKCQKDPKKTWILINQALGRKPKVKKLIQNPIEFQSQLIYNNKEIANNLNKFYVNIGNDLATKLSKSTNKFYLEKCDNSYEF